MRRNADVFIKKLYATPYRSHLCPTESRINAIEVLCCINIDTTVVLMICGSTDEYTEWSRKILLLIFVITCQLRII